MRVRFVTPDDHSAMFDILVSNGMEPALAPVYFVAEEAGRVIGGGGFCRITRENVGWLASVAVAKDMKRKGVGSAIVHRNIIQIRNSALGGVWLETYSWNSRFYDSLGFEGINTNSVPVGIKPWRVNKHCRFMALAISF